MSVNTDWAIDRLYRAVYLAAIPWYREPAESVENARMRLERITAEAAQSIYPGTTTRVVWDGTGIPDVTVLFPVPPASIIISTRFILG